MIESFRPPTRVLMGPGPSMVHPRVLQAGARPTLGHLDPSFIGMMDELKVMLQRAFQCDYETTFVVSGPGSAGMESCLLNLLEPGDQAVVCINGVFGNRLKEIVSRCGAQPVVVEGDWGSPVDPEVVESCLQTHPDASLVAFVHAETSTGAMSDARRLAELAHRYGCLAVADCVTSLAGSPLVVAEWQLDAVYSGSQKCLSCVPGLSPVTFSPAAMQRVQNRQSPVQSWFLDVSLLTGYWGEGQRVYHHTAPVNSLYALHEALVLLEEEGLSARWERHQLHHRALLAGLHAMGLSMVVDEAHRLPQLNAVWIPDGVDDATLRHRLLDDFQIEIGAGLGPFAGRVWRIGLMGESAHRHHVLRLLSALARLLSEMGQSIAPDAPLMAAEAIYDQAGETVFDSDAPVSER